MKLNLMNNLVNNFYNKHQNQEDRFTNIDTNIDGSLIYKDNATVFNDLIPFYFVTNNLVDYLISSTSYDIQTQYGIYKNNVWVKTSITKNEIKHFKFIKDNSSLPNNDSIFILYSDFNINEHKFILDNSRIESSHLIINGGNQIYGAKSKKRIPNNSIIEFNMYSNNADFDSGCKIGNLYFISDKGSGSHGIYESYSYPNGSQEADKWNDYRIILRLSNIEFTNLSVNKTVTSNLTYSKGNLQFINDADRTSNPTLIDYICVRKYYDEQDITINIEQTDYGYDVSITSSKNYNNIQIKIDNLPIGNYIVKENMIISSLDTKAFPVNKNSSIKSYTQIPHDAKKEGILEPHLHLFIPPEAQPGDIHFRLDYQINPISNVYYNNQLIETGNNLQPIISIDKIISITQNDIGKHIIISLDERNNIVDISDIIILQLHRLATEQDDTFNYDLPILSFDFHYEVNTPGGSQDIYNKGE